MSSLAHPWADVSCSRASFVGALPALEWTMWEGGYIPSLDVCAASLLTEPEAALEFPKR